MTKRVVLSGYFGFKNFGDELILSVLVNKLMTLDTSLTIITSDPDYTSNLYPNTKCVKTFDMFQIIKSILCSDILISGGGSLLQDVTSVKSLFYYLIVIFIAIFFNKKVIIFAQGIGPVNSKIGQFFMRLLLKKASYISVRDKKSAALLENWDIKSDIVCDPVFTIKPLKTQKSKIIGVQLRGWSELNEKFLNELCDVVSARFNDYKIEVYSLQDEIDTDVCNRFRNLLKNKNCNFDVSVYSNMSNNDVVNRICACEYLISMRFHAVIIGLLTGAKTLAINYDVKIEKLAEEFNLPILNLDNFDANVFDALIYQDLAKIESILSSKKFDWDNIVNCIMY